MAHGRGRGRRGGGGHADEHADERWLLTYADMITLLMALFIVMWSISTVNTSKFDELAKSLQDAFSGKILPGGEAVMQSGAGSKSQQAAPEPPLPAIRPTTPQQAAETQIARGAAQREQDELVQLKHRVDDYATTHGLAKDVSASVAQRGLVVRVLTDRVLFASGSATLKPQADGLLSALSGLLKTEVRHPIQVEGNTDDVPVRSDRFPTNWELSTARSTAVVRDLIARGVSPDRLSATGYADRHPVAANTTATGRARNRRVELVLLRTQGGTAP